MLKKTGVPWRRGIYLKCKPLVDSLPFYNDKLAVNQGKNNIKLNQLTYAKKLFLLYL